MQTIAILSRWNATCGISLHAELLGREFIRMGYRLKIFAPYVESADRWWHHKIIRGDEVFVRRCYEEVAPDSTGGALDEDAIMSEDFDFLIVESYTSVPYKRIEKLVPKIKRKAKIIIVVHEGKREDIKYPLEIFDKIVVFDERYRKMLGSVKEVEIIPYPCHPVVKGNRDFAEDGLKFFTFGRQPYHEYLDYIKALDTISKKYSFIYEVVRSDGLIPFKRPWLFQRRERPEDIYPLLHNSDIHLLPKGKTENVVVSSTFFLCLGSLVPIVAPNTRHFEMLPEINGVKPAVIYRDLKDLEEKIVQLVEDEELREKVIEAAENYVEENRSDKIAKKFIEVLNSI